MFLPIHIPDDTRYVLDRLEEDYAQTLTRNCVHAIIVLGQERTPIKKVDLYKLVFPTITGRSIQPAIIYMANHELNKVFGMRLYELDDKSKLLLVNSNSELGLYQNYTGQMREELTVLFFILMDIFAAPDEKKSEEELLDDVKGLDCDVETLKGYLELFVKKLYLITTRQQDHKMYAWGPRTIAEIDPEEFFKRFLELADDSKEEDWPDLKKRIDTLKKMEFR